MPTWVRLGELVLNNDGDSAQPKDFRIVERIPHPQYRAPAVYFDIMLLRLRDRVEFSPHMRPICLYTSPILSSSFNNGAIITGWGNTATGIYSVLKVLKYAISHTSMSKLGNIKGMYHQQVQPRTDKINFLMNKRLKENVSPIYK